MASERPVKTKSPAKKASTKKTASKKAETGKRSVAKSAVTAKKGGAKKSASAPSKTVKRAVRTGGAVAQTATLDGATASVLDRLFEVVTARRDADPNISHSARLLSRGTAKVAQKFGEEAVECLIEAVAGRSDKLVGESADVLYHLIVMWVDAGVHPAEIWNELHRREGTSGIAEKQSRATARVQES
ncbi:phosphoribosyl-ATP diphosphatase [Acetobacteraceae bacterium KSS8]|uniref:Phosphoribosyl-ATP pyrophosphatase n=1 Tax=Endosaccharibacter trunci TaxID=2812733 RepID=A0ABT1W9E7_9PROT|nr:phosphoribosyl-ATP diphosphatase [Acetobacteraceae bacterium KSS8]